MYFWPEEKRSSRREVLHLPRDGGLINGENRQMFHCLADFSRRGEQKCRESVVLFHLLCFLRAPHPLHSYTPPLKTAGCSDAGATSQRDPSRTTGQLCVSYRLHGRQGTDTTPRRWPAHSIGASEGRRLRASPRSSPVNRLPHPPSAAGTASRREARATSGPHFHNKTCKSDRGFLFPVLFHHVTED